MLTFRPGLILGVGVVIIKYDAARALGTGLDSSPFNEVPVRDDAVTGVTAPAVWIIHQSSSPPTVRSSAPLSR